MEILLKVILVLIFNSMQVYLVYHYFNKFFVLKVELKTFIKIMFIILLLSKFIPIQVSAFTKMLSFLLLLWLGVNICFRSTISKLIYHITFFSLLILLAEMILSIVVQYFALQIIENPNIIWIYFISNSLSQLLVLILIKLIVKQKQEDAAELDRDEYLLLSIIPMFSLISIYWIERYKMIPLIIPCLFYLTINVCLMLLYYRMTNKNFEIQKNMISSIQNEFYEKNMKDQKENAKLRHDLKNILLNLDYYLSNNDIQSARNMLYQITDIKINSYKIISGCIPIDAILDSKIMKMENNKIKYEMDIQVPENLKFENDIDIAAILGNLIDNAIEAIIRYENQENGKIIIQIKYNSYKVIIKIKNPTEYIESDLKKHQIKSMKGRNRLGIGISSIKDRVDKLGAYYDFSSVNNEFVSLVIIPIKHNR